MAKMRNQYTVTAIATACHVMPDQIAAKQAAWTNTNGSADG